MDTTVSFKCSCALLLALVFPFPLQLCGRLCEASIECSEWQVGCVPLEVLSSVTTPPDSPSP